MAKRPTDFITDPLKKAVKKKLLGVFPTTTPGRILNKTKAGGDAGGGYSVNVKTGAVPKQGLAVGRYANTDKRNTVVDSGTLNRAAIIRHADTNAAALDQLDSVYGTWRNPEDGKTYLDVAKLFSENDLRVASKFGERTNQLAGYNVRKGETFPIGRLQDFVAGPVFERRQKELAEQGYEYMRRMGKSPDWWPLQNTTLEEIYGKDLLPNVSGYTASTAPMTAPRTNMQQASEYLRRHIVGEPAVQPTWRTPEGLMNSAPGKVMPMEKSRALNLERSQRGALGELSREKVNREGAALMGDPNPVVVDRWHIRTAEDPSLGVYVAPEEGTIGSSKNYNLIENRIADIARQMGDEPARMSSMSWTGGRERARTTGDLFGVPYRKGSIPAESYGYPSHAEDLIRAKAKQLGVSEGKVKQLLRSGSINLMARGGRVEDNRFAVRRH